MYNKLLVQNQISVREDRMYQRLVLSTVPKYANSITQGMLLRVRYRISYS
jgi:hypothetical protein